MPRTRVSRDVFPEPLRPVRRNVGNVVEDVERYITKCRKSGIESTTRAVMTMARGVGCKSFDNRLCESDQAMTAIQALSRLEEPSIMGIEWYKIGFVLRY